MIKPIQYFIFGVVFLVSLYLILMRVTTGSSSVAISQFNLYLPWILTLSFGFGIQLALYKVIKVKHMETMVVGNVTKVTGATSVTTMVACCAHHAVDILPFVGATALASFLGVYTKELFAVGIMFNLFGIWYMLKKLRGLNYGKI